MCGPVSLVLLYLDCAYFSPRCVTGVPLLFSGQTPRSALSYTPLLMPCVDMRNWNYDIHPPQCFRAAQMPHIFWLVLLHLSITLGSSILSLLSSYQPRLNVPPKLGTFIKSSNILQKSGCMLFGH